LNEYKNDEKLKTNDKTHHEENWNVFLHRFWYWFRIC